MTVQELQIHWSRGSNDGDGVVDGPTAMRLILVGRAVAATLLGKLPASLPAAPRKIFVRCVAKPDPRHFGLVGKAFEVEIPFDYGAARLLSGAAVAEHVASHLVLGLARVSEVTGWDADVLAVAKDAAEQDQYSYRWLWPKKKAKAPSGDLAYLELVHGPESFVGTLFVVRRNGKLLAQVPRFVSSEPHEVQFMPLLGSLAWRDSVVELRAHDDKLVSSYPVSKTG